MTCGRGPARAEKVICLDVPSDEVLLRRFVEGRRAALGDLARRYEGPLLGLARGLLRGRDDLAADAVQETWVRVIRFAPTFNGDSGVKTWLYRIALNRCRDMAALAARQDARTAATNDSAQHDNSPGVDATAIALERNAAIRAAVDSLDEPQREILLLCYHEGLTHSEAATALEIPIGTLKSRLHAALTTLRQRLDREAI